MLTDASNSLEFRGLSSDAKPTKNVPNGSIFFEIDTEKAYMFDKENKIWREL